MSASHVSADPRCQPLLLLERRQIEDMRAPLSNGAGIQEVTRVGGGVVNTVYRVALVSTITVRFRWCSASAGR